MPEDSRQSVQISHLETVLAGKYKILGKIGAGGFGEVYLGEHTQLHRKVAIKVLIQSISTQEDLVKRFQREARSAAALTHPNIIDIYDVGEGEGLYYFVMKFIEGDTLSQKMQKNRLMDPAEAISIIKQVADALDYAHHADVVHRDIKPANVMLDSYGKPLLMDFGVARVQYEGNLTKTGTLLGTPHYLAPEQPLGKPIDGRSDIYSLGVMFYEMLAGRPPFHDENSITLIFKHINEPPQPLNAQVPELDPELCFIVHKMIEKSPENRFQTAGEVVDALEKMEDIYPPPVAASARRTTTGKVMSTEKLLILAQEHLDQNLLSKAIELLGTIQKKEPENETAKRQIQEVISKLDEQVHSHVAAKEFRKAHQLISQITQISPQTTSILRLREEVKKQETEYKRESETVLKEHYEAAQNALQNDRTSQAIEHLTRAATIDSDSQEVKALLRETEGKIRSQIKVLCEGLDFNGAQRVLDMGKVAFPEMVESKAPAVKRHSELYQTLLDARSLIRQEKWSDAEKTLLQFLESKAPYDFDIFNSLKTEAENLLDQARQKLKVSEKPTPATISKEAAAAVARSAGKTSMVRLAVYIVIGALFAGAAWWVTNFLKEQAEIPSIQPDPTIIKKLAPKPEDPKPTFGEITITSDPEGAAVFVGDQNKGKTPLKLSELAFGKYSVTLKLQGYQDLIQEIDVNENQALLELPAVLQPVAKVIGSLVIESNPSGAFIAIGSRVVGSTPKTLPETTVGKYTITLKKDGYTDYKETIRVKEGETTTVKAQLVMIPKAVVQEKPKEEPELKPGTLVTLGPDVIPPKNLKKSSVEYPESARKQKLEGNVQLSLLISETGQVLEVKVIKSAHPVLDEAATRTVKQWVYEPATKKGIPVRVWLTTSITFVKR